MVPISCLPEPIKKTDCSIVDSWHNQTVSGAVRNGNKVPDIAVRVGCRSAVARDSPPYVGFLFRCYSDPYFADREFSDRFDKAA